MILISTTEKTNGCFINHHHFQVVLLSGQCLSRMCWALASIIRSAKRNCQGNLFYVMVVQWDVKANKVGHAAKIITKLRRAFFFFWSKRWIKILSTIVGNELGKDSVWR